MLGGLRGHQRICGTARLQHTASSCKNNTCNTLIINTLLHLATVFTSYKNRTCNTLIINTLLHSATVGVGFIPILLTAGEMKRELHRRWWGVSPSYCHVDDSFSQSRKGRKGCAQQITDNAYSFLTKTRKTLAVMQGLRPLFLSGTVVLRSKLRPAGTRKKQPSFLRLASRQGKPGKPLTPRGIATPAWNILAAHSHIMLNNHATY